MKILSFTLFFTLFLFSCKSPNPNRPGGGDRGASSLDWSKASQASLKERAEILAESLLLDSPGQTTDDKQYKRTTSITQETDLQVSWTDGDPSDGSKVLTHTKEKNTFPWIGLLPPGSTEQLPATYEVNYTPRKTKYQAVINFDHMNIDERQVAKLQIIKREEALFDAVITVKYEVPSSASPSPAEAAAKSHKVEYKDRLNFTVNILPKPPTAGAEALVRAERQLKEEILTYRDGTNLDPNKVNGEFFLPKVTEEYVSLQWGKPVKKWDSNQLETKSFTGFLFDSKHGIVKIRPMESIPSPLGLDTQSETFEMTFTFPYILTYEHNGENSKKEGSLTFKTLVKNQDYTGR